LGGPRFLQRFAARNAISEKSRPFRGNLLVHAIEQEDKESLKRSGNGEEDQENGDDDVLRNEEHKVSEHPRESDGNVNGQIDSQFLLFVSLIGFGGSCEGFVNFSSDEEEEDSVGGDDEESRNEEGHETGKIVGNPALRRASSRNSSIILSRTHTNAESQRKSPREKMVPLLEEL